MREYLRLATALLVLAIAMMACTTPFQPRLIRGSGNIVKENRISGLGRLQGLREK